MIHLIILALCEEGFGGGWGFGVSLKIPYPCNVSLITPSKRSYELGYYYKVI